MDETASTDSSASSDIPPPQQQKKKSNFIPGDPRIPMLVRVYGSIIAAISIEIMILTGIPFIISILFSITDDMSMFFTLLLYGVGIYVFTYVLYRMGKGVCNGERKAIYGLTFVGGLTLIIALEIIIAGSPIGGIILFIFVLALCFPPTWVSFRRWELFK